MSYLGSRSLAILLLLLPPAAVARADDGAPAPFQVPRMAMAFKMGAFLPSGDSGLWDFNEALLTTEPDDFDDFEFALEWQIRPYNHLEFAFELEFYEGVDHSEYRDFVDSAGFDILQTSTLSLVPMTFNVRWLPAGRYRRDAGGFLGVPRRVVPYLSVGGGLYVWEFEMLGDFVDLDTLEIFYDRFTSDGVTLGANAAVGIELPLSRAWSFVVEGRYHWASDELDDDFVGFDEFDLGGTSVLFGAVLQF